MKLWHPFRSLPPERQEPDELTPTYIRHKFRELSKRIEDCHAALVSKIESVARKNAERSKQQQASHDELVRRYHQLEQDVHVLQRASKLSPETLQKWGDIELVGYRRALGDILYWAKSIPLEWHREELIDHIKRLAESTGLPLP
jgi:hypothetical protein